MSVFFFRHHNLQRGEASKRTSIESHQIHEGKVRLDSGDLTNLAPSRLFEKTTNYPRDSLDEVSILIPRFDL
jgi:hypothetical protein